MRSKSNAHNPLLTVRMSFSFFLRVTFYVRVCWLLQLQQVHMKLLCRYFDNPSQFIFNQSDTMDHKTSKQCPSTLLPPRSAHITADTDPHQTAALRLPQICIRKHLYHSPVCQIFMNY